MVGPVPGLDADHNRRVGELNRAYMDVAERRGHTYVDVFTPLVDHAQWRSDLTANEDAPAKLLLGLSRGWCCTVDGTTG